MRRPSEIIKRGWTQNQWTSPEGGYCLLAAVKFCTLSKNLRQDLENYLRNKIGGISQWNDKEGRTREEVLELVLEAESFILGDNDERY